jgi:hypothetical protein
MQFIVKGKAEAEPAKAEEPTPAPSGLNVKHGHAKRREKELTAKGLRRVTFVVPIDLWKRFLELRCQGVKPNDVFRKWLQEQASVVNG